MSESGRPPARVHSSWAEPAGWAADWLSALLLISVTGVLISQGHDGLAYTLGISGAAFLWAVVWGPIAVVHPGSSNVSGFVAERYNSAAAGTAAKLVVLICLSGILAAEISAAASVSGLSTGSPVAGLIVAVAAAGGGVALGIAGIAGPRTGAWVAGVAAGAVLAALAVLSVRDGAGGLISIPVMAEVAGFEQLLLEKRLADPATFKPHAVPFLRTDALNFSCLVVCLAFGLALLGRQRGASAARDATWHGKIAGRAVVLVTGVLVMLPPVAAAAKRALLELFANGVRPAALPEWLGQFLQTGAVQICGTASADVATLVKACGKGVGPQGLMRWQEAVFAPDALLFAGLQASGAGPLMYVLTSVAVLATAWTARRIGLLAAETFASVKPLENARSEWMPSVFVLLAAATIAVLKPADAVTIFTWSASLAAASLAPVVFGSVFIRHASASGALFAILAGAGVTLGAILAARYVPLDLFAWTHTVSSAPPAVLRKLATLQDAWAAAADGPGKDALRTQAEKLARDNLSWFGLKPLSAGVFGLAIGSIILVAGTLASRIATRIGSRQSRQQTKPD